MKVKINKTFDMYDKELLYCEQHNEKFSLINVFEHVNCNPEPVAITKIPWYVLFYKCLHVKTGPNLNDIAEGIFKEQWSKNESKRVKLFEDIADKIEERDDSV